MNIVKEFFSSGWKYAIVGASFPAIWFFCIALVPYPWNGMATFAYLGACVGLLIWWGKKNDFI